MVEVCQWITIFSNNKMCLCNFNRRVFYVNVILVPWTICPVKRIPLCENSAAFRLAWSFDLLSDFTAVEGRIIHHWGWTIFFKDLLGRKLSTLKVGSFLFTHYIDFGIAVVQWNGIPLRSFNNHLLFYSSFTVNNPEIILTSLTCCHLLSTCCCW